MERRHPNRSHPLSASYSGRGWDERKEFRQTHDGPEVGVSPAKKNTRKWCKGRPGLPHSAPEFGEWGLGYHRNLCVLRCERCGKHLEEWFESSWFLVKRTRPDWVPPRPTDVGRLDKLPGV